MAIDGRWRVERGTSGEMWESGGIYLCVLDAANDRKGLCSMYDVTM